MRIPGVSTASPPRASIPHGLKFSPDAIERWIGYYEANRIEDEEWNDFAARVGTSELETLVKDLSMPVDFGLETMSQFIDWNRDVPFEVIRGEGECAV